MAEKKKTAASSEFMDSLHNELAKVLLEQINKFRKSDEGVPASLLNVVRQFLKDNHVEKMPGNPETDPLLLLGKEVDLEDEEEDFGSTYGG